MSKRPTNRNSTLLLCLVLLSLLLPGSSWGSTRGAAVVELTPEEQSYLQAHPKLRVQIGNWAPLNYSEYGEIKGFSNEYIELLASKLGIQIEHVGPFEFKTYLEMLKTHQLDLITNLNRTPEREKSILFSERSTVDIHDALLFRENHPPYKGLTDLHGSTVAVVRGYFHEELLRKHHPQINLLLTQSPLDLVRSVVDGRADAAIESLPVFHYYTTKYFFSGLRAEPLFTSQLFKLSSQYIGIRSDRPILKRIIDKAMAVITEQERTELLQRWMILSGKHKVAPLAATELSPSERLYLQQKGGVSYCVTPDWMPVERLTDGQHSGISAELSNFLEQKLQTSLTLQPTRGAEQTAEMVKQRACDLITLTDQRAKLLSQMDLSRPLLESPLVLATHFRKPFVDDLTALNQQTIGVLKGHAAAEIMRRVHPEVGLVEVESTQQGLEQVSQSSIDGYIGPLLSVSYAIQKRPLDLKINRRLEHIVQFSVATRNDEPLLGSIIEKSLDPITPQLIRQWVDHWSSIRQLQQVDYSTILTVTLISVAVFLILLYRQQLLQRHQRELKNNIIVLDAAMEQATRVMREQENFISMIAHEISNPLASINASTELIGLYTATPKNQAIESELNRIGRTVVRLSELVDGMLLNEWIDATAGDEWERSRIDLGQTLTQLSSEYQATLLVPQEPPLLIQANPTLITVALSNILNNAKKFASSPEAVVIEVMPREEEHLAIHIRDDGPGITTAEQERIFEKFYRSSHGKEKTGSGLGLFIARKIIHFHHGEITVNPAFSGGTEFLIVLPVDGTADRPDD